MALIGDLKDINMQDILRFLKRVNKSGVLKIKGEKEGEVYFKDGKIVNIKIQENFVSQNEILDKCVELLRQREGEFRLNPEEDIPVAAEIDPDMVVKKLR